MIMKKYIRQNPRLNKRISTFDSSYASSVVRRPAQSHHDLRRAKVLDGVTSTTGIWDAEQGDVPEVFDIHVNRLDLADSLLRRGESMKNATKVATNSQTTEQVE